MIFQKIQEFIDDSPNGVIYFTFGSVVAMSTLPEHIQNTFKNVFRRIPQRVLWKFEGEMKDKPDNVMTGNWFPQRDVLGECCLTQWPIQKVGGEVRGYKPSGTAFEIKQNTNDSKIMRSIITFYIKNYALFYLIIC